MEQEINEKMTTFPFHPPESFDFLPRIHRELVQLRGSMCRDRQTRVRICVYTIS